MELFGQANIRQPPWLFAVELSNSGSGRDVSQSPIELSLVICGRNDNCNGDFERRASLALRHNEALLRRFQVSHEWVYVEWNPLPDRPLFADSLFNWVAPGMAYVVPAPLHRARCSHPHLGMLQFHAKNCGLRRARAEWILVVNTDTFLTEHLVRSIAGAPSLRHDTLYLADRLDIPRDGLNPDAPEPFPFDFVRVPVIRDDPIAMPHRFGAAGDFMLAHQSVFNRVKGYFEGIRFSNVAIDILFCRQALSQGIRIECLGNVYHVEHADEFRLMPDAPTATPHHHGVRYCERHVAIPYQNPSDWGLMSCHERLLRPGIIELVMPDTSPGATPCTSADMPPELAFYATFEADLRSAVRELQSHRRVLIYGFGKEACDAFAQGALNSLAIVGCLDDEGSAPAQTPFPSVRWSDVPALDPDALLIGSLWWCYDLAGKVKAQGLTSILYPAKLRALSPYGAANNVITTHVGNTR